MSQKTRSAGPGLGRTRARVWGQRATLPVGGACDKDGEARAAGAVSLLSVWSVPGQGPRPVLPGHPAFRSPHMVQEAWATAGKNWGSGEKGSIHPETAGPRFIQEKDRLDEKPSAQQQMHRRDSRSMRARVSLWPGEGRRGPWGPGRPSPNLCSQHLSAPLPPTPQPPHCPNSAPRAGPPL